MRILTCLAILGAGFLAATVSAEVILKDDFSANSAQEGAPAGWGIYKTGPNAGRIAVEERDGQKVVILDDQYDDSEIGLTRTFPAEGGKTYRIGLKSRFLDDNRRDIIAFQLRFQPENKPNQITVQNINTETTAYTQVTAQAPADTRQAIIYIYAMKAGKAAAVLEDFVFESSDGPFADPSPWKGEKATLIKSSLSDVTPENPLPKGWRKYSQGPVAGTLAAVQDGDGYVLSMTDDDDASEIGISHPFAVVPGAYYRATVKARTPAGAPEGWTGFLLQISGHPSKTQAQTRILGSGDFVTYTATLKMPDDAKSGFVYLYSHRQPKGTVLVKDFQLEKSDTPFAD